MNNKYKRFFWLIASTIIFVSVDQIIKYIIRLRYPANGGFYICNVGISFGIKLPEILIWIIYSMIGLGLFYLLYRRKFRYNFTSLALIIGGGMSNIIDRAISGCIIDYIDIRIWPVFNLADMMIVLGAAILIFLNWNKSQCESTN
jgi:signal peptidase II